MLDSGQAAVHHVVTEYKPKRCELTGDWPPLGHGLYHTIFVTLYRKRHLPLLHVTGLVDHSGIKNDLFKPSGSRILILVAS